MFGSQTSSVIGDEQKNWTLPELEFVIWRPSEICSWDDAKRLQFSIGGIPLVETVRAIACRQIASFPFP
jgi:hypothetical protein